MGAVPSSTQIKEGERVKMQKKSVLISFVLMLLFMATVPLKTASEPAEPDSWWDFGWLYRKPVAINNTQNPYNLTNYQVFLHVVYEQDMRSNFEDIRFAWYNSTSGMEQEINYWIEKNVSSSYAKVWIKIPFIKGSTYYSKSNTTVFMYYKYTEYGNVYSTSNGTQTFDFFDGYEDGSTDWVIVDPNAVDSITATREEAFTGDYSTKINTTYGGDGDIARQVFPNSFNPDGSHAFLWRGKIRCLIGYAHVARMHIEKNSSNANYGGASFEFTPEQIGYQDENGWQATGVPYSDNTWYKFEVVSYSTKYDLHIYHEDGSQLYSKTSINYRDGTLSSVEAIQVHKLLCVEYLNYYVDNLIVRQYSSPEPTATVEREWIELKYETPYPSPESPWVYVLVDSNVYGGIETSLIRYAADVENSEFAVRIYNVTREIKCSNGTAIVTRSLKAPEVRCFLQEALPKGLNGCFLVGHIPHALYTPGFPTDLYYMDLDGEWTTSGSPVYTGHTGDVEPEIWVGRLYTSDTSKINHYFDKNHRYRTGDISMALPRRALIYDVVDLVRQLWKNLLPEIKELYKNTIYVNSSTTASDYKQRLKQGFQMSFVSAHGDPTHHYFYSPPSTFNIEDYAESRVYFYQYDSCNTAQYTNDPNMACYCIFNTDYGLIAIGPTNAGGFSPWWSQTNFYELLSQGKCFGAAFKEWAQGFSLAGDLNNLVLPIVMAGDPTLQVEFAAHDVIVTNVTPWLPYDAEFVFPGWKFGINVTVENKGTETKTFDVAAYYENTPIGTQTATLNVGENTTLAFWGACAGDMEKTYPYPPYWIKAGANDTNKIDTKVGFVNGSWPGDASRDGCVDVDDLQILGWNWQKTVPPGDPRADFSFDGLVDVDDLQILGWNWQKGFGDAGCSGAASQSEATSQGGSTTKVYVDPQTSTAAIGKTFTINIAVSDVENLYGWSAGIKFNASVLRCLSFEEGPFLRQGGNTISVSGTIDNENGTIYPPYGCSLTEPCGGVNGTGVLASITFEVIGLGDSYLNLINLKLGKMVEGNPEQIPFEAINGHFEKWHDVAVTNVTLSYNTTVVYPTWINSPKINVTVKNEGLSSETFNVTAYYKNATGTYTIGTKAVTNLAQGANTTLTFTWNVPPLPGYPNNRRAAWPYPNYTIFANASVVPHEVDTSDNSYVYGNVKVQWPGDANGDGHVNDNDKAILDAAWDKKYGQPGYDPRADFNGDGLIDIDDLIIYIQNRNKGPLD